MPNTTLSLGHRKFYYFPDINTDDVNKASFELTDDCAIDTVNETSTGVSCSLFGYISQNIIGNSKSFSTPFGLKKVIYCDYTASGRSLSFIEDYIRDQVLPNYGNTHTTTTFTSMQTTFFLHEARDIIRNAVRASDHDAVIFVGSGCTAAIHKLVHNLNLPNTPIVLVGPFEHHSNLLIWRHIAHKVVRIGLTTDGVMDLAHLEEVLKRESSGSDRQIIGTFSAASNITGVLTDTNAVSALLHRYGGLVFWDYATLAPYTNIDMNPVVTGPDQSLVYKDALFFSGHKFVGGLQTPGVLIAKKSLFHASQVYPTDVGGGNVFFVRREGQLYLQDVEYREEGGTPPIVQSIRAGLVFQLKQSIGADVIMARETELTRLAWSYFAECPNLVILGGSQAPRLPIFSFLVSYQSSSMTSPLYLHHNFVTALLNDLFGIQTRGGCACAGPYALDLLGIGEQLAVKLEEILVGSGLDQFVRSKYFNYPHREFLRPGFTRFNLPYFMPPDEVQFVLKAVAWISHHGWSFLPLYRVDPITGEWCHRARTTFKDRQWLGSISYATGRMTWGQPVPPPSGDVSKNYEEMLALADSKLIEIQQHPLSLPGDDQLFDETTKTVKWFLMPSEAADILWPQKSTAPDSFKNHLGSPFSPATLTACFSNGVQQFPSSPSHHSQKFIASSCGPPCVSCNLKIDSVTHMLKNTQLSSEAPAVEITDERPSNTPVSDDVKPTDSSNISSNNHRISQAGNNAVTISTEPIMANVETGQTHNVSLFGDNTSTTKLDSPVTKTRVQKKAKERVWKNLWRPPSKDIYKPFVQAINDYNMIKSGDRILVCLSGGKDSLSLLHALHQYQLQARGSGGLQFTLGAVTVDPQTSAYDPRPLIPYLEKLGVPYFFESQGIMDQALSLPYTCESICSFCSRMKRGRLYAVARREGYNVLAMGQHLDDLAESFLMSIIHNGLLRTMKANYTIKNGDLRVIRPLVYVREKYTRKFADSGNLPVIPENCPACFEAPKERFRMKQLLAEQEIIFPFVFTSLLSAMKPLMAYASGHHPSLLGIQLTNGYEEEDQTNEDTVL